ncbi:dynamin family protein [soil metagenome]
MPPPIARAARLRADLDRLADEVAAAGFGIASPDQSSRRARRDELVEVVRSYLIPRLGDPDAPLVVALAGPTGSGKSTILNSVAGYEVSRPGPLRPTTRQPVVWCHEREAHRYQTMGGVECLVVTEGHPLLADLTLIDTPDIDSYVSEHRRIATAVLRQADVVVFVTSAQRYADAVPWEVVDEVDRRGSQIIFVLNRLSRRAAGSVSDYAALLRARGLDPEPIHTIQEQRVRGEAGALPARSIRHLSRRLGELASGRTQVLAEATRSTAAYSVFSAKAVADDIDRQEEERARLAAVVAGTYDGAFAELTGELTRGALIRSEVVQRWGERVGTGAVARRVKGSTSWLRVATDRLAGRPSAEMAEIGGEARRELVAAVGARLDRAARAVTVSWEVDAAGRAFVTPDLRTAAHATRQELDATIDRWLSGLTHLVEAEAPGRFKTARVASTGVNAAAVATILAIFASTGGLTGAEVGVAAGAAAAQQSILEHLLGRAAAGSLAGNARAGLMEAVGRIFTLESQRFLNILEMAADPIATGARIREAARVVEAESEIFHAQ